MDLFVCGICRKEFHDIGQFIHHKKVMADAFTCPSCDSFFHLKEELMEHVATHADLNEENNDENRILQSIQIVYSNTNNMPSKNVDDMTKVTTGEENSQTEVESESSSMVLSVDSLESTTKSEEIVQEQIQLSTERLLMCRLCSNIALNDEDMHRHLNEIHEQSVTLPSPEFEFNVNRLVGIKDGAGNISFQVDDTGNNVMQLELTQDTLRPGSIQIVIRPAVSSDGRPKRRRGRPRKNEQQEKKEEAVKRIEEKPKPEEPILGLDGKFHCSRCKKAFSKVRHFTGHRCWGANAEHGDYIDLSAKELMKENEDEVAVVNDNDMTQPEVDSDPTEDYKAYVPRNGRWSCSRGRRRFRSFGTGRKRTVSVEDGGALEGDGKENQEVSARDCALTADESQNTRDVNVTNDQPKRVPSGSSSVPVFSNETERKEFEDKMNYIDLSCVDELFMTHVVAQDINENATQIVSREKEQLEVYSCTVCKKVFKTLSHIRLHCVTHTDLKPFKCPECSYASNAKGNLYTHMRKHTKNFFVCPVCDFRSCNRSHMAEHEATHSNVRHKCRICSNDYNTLKSLMNHVRKYHRSSKSGREYLMTFMLKANRSAAILHQCQVCNRKFKKRLDRDRHLYSHNIHPNGKRVCCQLCEYTTTRAVHLEQHFRKHRMIYVCCECKVKFLSSVQLQEHLQSHVQMPNKDRGDQSLLPNCGCEREETSEIEVVSEDTFSQLFEKSVNMSWYLPEPDGLVNAYRYANVPEELRCDPGHLETVAAANEINESNLARDKDEEKSVGEQVAGSDPKTDWDVISALNYKQLSMAILNKIREYFGNDECRTCGRLFHGRADFELHLKTHEDDKPHKCLQCEYSAITKENLKRHLETVHERRRFLCDQCGYTAPSRTSMWHHQQKHREVPVECPECHKMLGNARKLQSHVICSHPHISRAELNKLPGLNRRLQGRLGRRSYKCPYCERVFHRSNTDLQKHIWIHEGIKPFKCPLCSHSCRSRNNLNVHMMRHSNEKPHVCTQCGKAYKSKTALRWHIRSHAVQSMFTCNQCPYTATQKSHLKRHQDTHDVMKRYFCEHCKYSANSNAYMRMHYAKRHKSSSIPNTAGMPENGDSKGIKCVGCEYNSHDVDDVNKHMKQEHHQLNVVNVRGVNWSDDDAALVPDSSRHSDDTDAYQLVQVETDQGTTLARISSSALQELQMASMSDEMDESTASVVNIIQQIIEQGNLTRTNNNDDNDNDHDHELVALNPDSVMVGESNEIQEVIVSGSEVKMV